MRNQILLYITLLWSYSSFAQPYLSVRGDFSIDQRRGCHDMFVSVTNINPGTDVILYQYEGKSSMVTANTSFTYTTTGNYWLYQYIQGPTGQKVDSIFIEILDPVIPEFELQSCNNNDVQVLITNIDYDLYEIDYGDGSIIQVPVNTFTPIYNYPVPGIYNVTVTGLYTTATNRCGSSTTSFTPVNQVQPASFNFIQTIDKNRLVLDYSLAPNTVSSLEISLNNSSGFQLFKQLNPATTRDTLNGLQLDNIYCFRIASHDACSNFRAYSNELCSITADLSPVNEAMNLAWNTLYSPNYSDVEIVRDGSTLLSFTTQPLTYADSLITCNTEYCYQIISSNADGTQSISNLICETAFSSAVPAPVANVSTVINDENIRWTWQTPTGETALNFTIRDENGFFLTNTVDSSYTNLFPDNAEVCLLWTYVNSCEVESQSSRTICPFVADYELRNDGSVDINWNAFNGWESSVQYYSVVIYNQSMVQLDSINVGNMLTYNDPLPDDNTQVSLYRVYAIPVEASVTYSSSNLLRVERPPVIAIPSSFTPNNDGLNDLFVVSGKYIQTIDITILNRWGSVIYQTESNAWDGTTNSKKVPAGTYVYQITVKDFADNEHIRTGSVLILED